MGRDEELLASLGGWSGFEIADFERQGGDPEEVWITLRRKRDEPLYCGECGREASRIHEYQERVVRDLPLFDARTYLRIESADRRTNRIPQVQKANRNGLGALGPVNCGDQGPPTGKHFRRNERESPPVLGAVNERVRRVAVTR
jgi:hypothetical protein